MKRLIVNADDFGKNRAANQAVLQAFQQGILTTASLMVNGEACDEAVEMARQNPRLGVGLHLCLVCGSSALPQTSIPGLVDQQRRLDDNAVRAGCRYFFLPGLRDQLRAEIIAQLQKFKDTGLPMDHVNGHLNIHLHPVILPLLVQNGPSLGMRACRLTRDSFRLSLKLSSGRWFYRLSHAIIFNMLSRRARRMFDGLHIKYTPRVYGLMQTGRVGEDYVLGLLPRLAEGDAELYSHPSVSEAPEELAALTSPRVKALVEQLQIKLIRYQDL